MFYILITKQQSDWKFYEFITYNWGTIHIKFISIKYISSLIKKVKYERKSDDLKCSDANNFGPVYATKDAKFGNFCDIGALYYWNWMTQSTNLDVWLLLRCPFLVFYFRLLRFFFLFIIFSLFKNNLFDYFCYYLLTGMARRS